jgi:SAM-dependent methyltransferase
MTTFVTDWHEVWERKGETPVEEYDLETLIALDGFDSGLGAMTPDQFRALAGLVQRTLGLRAGSRVLDVGCGAGALLWCLRETGAELYGIDYSPTLVAHARAALPEARIEVGEATDLPFQVDAIVCHSVFHYFPDYEYARRVVRAFRRAAPVSLILDVPDLATRTEAEVARIAGGARPGRHLYYPRPFFKGTVWGSRVHGYGNAPYRFNALLPGLRSRRLRRRSEPPAGESVTP